MNWAKLSSSATFNLARSGMLNFPLSDLPVRLEDLEITGPVSYGYPPLKQAIAARYDANAENVVLAAGTSMANHLAMAAILEPGDEVLLETPAYEPLFAVSHYLNAKVVRFNRKLENDFQLDLAELERAVSSRTKLIVLTNLHNPSSALTDRASLLRLRMIARSTNARVLVDEVYLDAVFDQHRLSAFHLGPEFIVTSSLTKVYGLSGLRCGWILAEEPLAQKMRLLDDLFSASPVHIAEKLSMIALKHLDEAKQRTEQLLAMNRPFLNIFFDSRKDLIPVRTKYGTTSFPKWKGGNTGKLVALLRHKYETSVVPGKFFGFDDHFRIGLCCETDVFREGLNRLNKALNDS